MLRITLTWLAIAGVVLALVGCRTVATDREDRPWWHTTIDPAAVPWPLPTGDLAMVDYHNAHGAGWWDAPWVLAEQAALMPSYFLWGVGEWKYTELLDGGYSYDPDQWQWRAVNWVMGPPYAVISSVNLAAVWLVDTVGHDPIAALIWAMKG